MVFVVLDRKIRAFSFALALPLAIASFSECCRNSETLPTGFDHKQYVVVKTNACTVYSSSKLRCSTNHLAHALGYNRD